MPALRAGLFLTLATAAGCTTLYHGFSAVPDANSAVIHSGAVIVREIDGQERRGGVFDVQYFRVAPGKHQVTLVYSLPARTVGVRDVPTQRGQGVCVLDFSVRAGHEYWLGASPIGDAWVAGRWDGRWEGWIRSEASNGDDGIIARCTSQPTEDRREPPTLPQPLPALADPPDSPPAPASPTPSVPASAGEAAQRAPQSPEVAVVAPVAAAAPTAAPAVAASPQRPVPPAIDLPPQEPPRGIRFASWHRQQIRGTALAGLANAIERSFDVVAIADLPPGPCGRLLTALGDDWRRQYASEPANGAQVTGDGGCIVYRHTRVRPCPTRSAPADLTTAAGADLPPLAGCFELVGGE